VEKCRTDEPIGLAKRKDLPYDGLIDRKKRERGKKREKKKRRRKREI